MVNGKLTLKLSTNHACYWSLGPSIKAFEIDLQQGGLGNKSYRIPAAEGRVKQQFMNEW